MEEGDEHCPYALLWSIVDLPYLTALNGQEYPSFLTFWHHQLCTAFANESSRLNYQQHIKDKIKGLLCQSIDALDGMKTFTLLNKTRHISTKRKPIVLFL